MRPVQASGTLAGMTFVRVARALSTALVCASAVAACSGSDDTSPDPTGTSGGESEPAKLESIGRFKVTVDPTAAEPIRFEPIEDDASRPGTQSTSPLPSTDTVLSSISLAGPGTWNPTTQTLSTTVVMTHTGVIPSNFNEPQMVVTALSDTTGTVTFITSDNPGVQGIGATMAFPDLQRPVGATNICGAQGIRSSAQRFFAIKDTEPATSFSFTVDVRALKVLNNTGISPDCDNDSVNAEVGQDAGGDCNNLDASVTGSQCDCTSQCTSAGTTCTQPVTSGTFTCQEDATHPCACNVNAAGGTDVNVTCANDCAVNCDGAADTGDAQTVACRNTCQGETCSLNCSNITTGSCQQACSGTNQAGADCNLTCANNATICETTQCNSSNGGASTCSTSCVGGGQRCGISSCGNDSTCDVTCGTSTAQANFTQRCGINSCGRDSVCIVACVNPAPGGQGCTLNCGNNSADCQMDCSSIPAGSRATLCKLNCGNKTKVDIGGGLFQCQ